MSTPEGYQQAIDTGVFRDRCPVFVRDAVNIIEQLLTESEETR